MLPERRRRWLFLAAVGAGYFGFGAALAYSLYYSPPSVEVEVDLFLIGERIDPHRPVRQQIVATSRRYLAQEIKLVDSDSFEKRVTPRSLGTTVDYRRLENIIASIRSNKVDIARLLRNHGKLQDGKRGRIDLSLPVEINYEEVQNFLMNLKFEYDRSPENARIDMETRKVLPHRAGRRLLLDDTMANMELGLSKGLSEIQLGVDFSEPATKTDDLREVDISHVLGWYETPYCMQKKCWDRNHNLALSGKLLDGTIVWPGGVFDFNEILGPRTEARGFRPAPTIEQGILTATPGGGVCQTASTLYAAAFFAGMDLLQRRPHSRPSEYILLGLDATVSYPNINLVFRNPFDFPVVIHYKVGNGKMRVEILGKERHRRVHLIRHVTQQIPFSEKIVEEPEWPRGVSVVTQVGINGYRVRRYRVIWDGSHMEREMTENVYPPTTRIVHVGTNPATGAKDFKPPLEPDDSPPYKADRRIKFYLNEKNEFKKIIADW